MNTRAGMLLHGFRERISLAGGALRRVCGQPNSRRRDFFLLATLLCLNPVVFGTRLPLSLTPDAVSYLAFAETAIATGQLFMSGWGHIDTAMVLPPLYPSLIALANVFRPDSVGNALAISAICMLLLTIPIFFCIRLYAHAAVAALAVLLIQLNFYYVFLASSIFTEALFLLLIATVLYLAQRTALRGGPSFALSVVLGVLAGLVFLARQIGLIVGLFLAAWMLVEVIRAPAPDRGRTARTLLAFLGGWSVVTGAYAAVLYGQTGKSIFHQSFRAQAYVVTTADSALLDRIRQVESGDDTDYTNIYRNRRQLRQLLPDSTEMLAYLVPAAGMETGTGGASPDSDYFESGAGRTWSNLGSNLGHVRDRFGVVFVGVWLLAMVMPLVTRTGRFPCRARLVLPGFLVAYCLGISMLTGAVARYLYVLFPLIAALIAVELGLFFEALRARFDNARVLALGGLLVFFGLFLSLPQTVLNSGSRMARTTSAAVAKSSALRDAPAFALLPVYPYLAGGSFRILPNDALEKVVQYGRRTGVRWLLVPSRPERIVDTQYYENAGWIREPESLKTRTDLLLYAGEMNLLQDHLLFEILPATSVREQPAPR